MNEKHNLDPKVREVYEKAGIDLDEVAKSSAKTYKEWKREHLPSPLKRLARFFSREVIPFQCNHCGETLYAPSEEEMEVLMEKHLHKSHPEETRRELSPLERAFSEQSRKSQ